MAVVITSFEYWLEAVYMVLEKYGLDLDIEIAVYRDAFDSGLSPEEAVREDACL